MSECDRNEYYVASQIYICWLINYILFPVGDFSEESTRVGMDKLILRSLLRWGMRYIVMELHWELYAYVAGDVSKSQCHVYSGAG
jgi:hypothetical protein